MELAKRTGLIVIFVIFLTGILACFDLYTKLNIKSAVYGYFYTEPEVIQINNFEYDITSLLFTNTGTKNQYIAKATTKAVSGFDKNKKYTATINGNLCSTTTNTDYINVTFTNQFNSTSDNILLTDELNIKINFYKDGTQLVFITNNGEQAVKLWASYISKHGFKIKLVESSYTSSLEVENLRKITYSIEVRENGNTRYLEFNDYCQLNIDYDVKDISDLTELASDYTFLGFAQNQTELDNIFTATRITTLTAPTEDVTLYGLIMDYSAKSAYAKTGELTINVTYSPSLDNIDFETEFVLFDEDNNFISSTTFTTTGTYVFTGLSRALIYNLRHVLIIGSSVDYIVTPYEVTFDFYSTESQTINIKVSPPNSSLGDTTITI